MNRYTVQGLVADAAEGKRVVIVGSGRVTNDMFHELKRVGGDSVEKAVASNGRQRLYFKWGGEIRFALSERSLRGVAADIVFIPDVESGQDPDLVASAFAAVSTSQFGEVIRA